jgi:hypothetical protein
MRHIVILLLCLACAAVRAQGLPVQPLDSVIFLTKNTNNNQVHYGVHVDDKCRPLETKPAYAYWRMLEEGPKERAKLMFWEEPGYGVEQPEKINRGVDSGSFGLVIRGVSERIIRLETIATESNCGARAFTQINGKNAVLLQIDIYVSGWANVHKVEIHGVDEETGQPVNEVTFEE